MVAMKPGAVSAEGYVEAEGALGHDEVVYAQCYQLANGGRPVLVEV